MKNKPFWANQSYLNAILAYDILLRMAIYARFRSLHVFFYSRWFTTHSRMYLLQNRMLLSNPLEINEPRNEMHKFHEKVILYSLKIWHTFYSLKDHSMEVLPVFILKCNKLKCFLLMIDFFNSQKSRLR